MKLINCFNRSPETTAPYWVKGYIFEITKEEMWPDRLKENPEEEIL